MSEQKEAFWRWVDAHYGSAEGYADAEMPHRDIQTAHRAGWEGHREFRERRPRLRDTVGFTAEADGVIRAHLPILAECYEVLGEVEWCGGARQHCPACGGHEVFHGEGGHAPDCRLSALREKLKEALGE